MMSIVLLLLGIANYKLDNIAQERLADINGKRAEIVDLHTQLGIMRQANTDAIVAATREADIIEKRVVEIKKVYVPQTEYIDRYIGDNNETNCNNSNGLLNSFVY